MKAKPTCLEVASQQRESSEQPREAVSRRASLDQIYSEHFDFVWRNARRLGVPESSAEDVVQDVFLVIHRRYDDFREGPIRPWIFGILSRVVRDYKRTHRRKLGRWVALEPEAAAPTYDPLSSPGSQAERAQRVNLIENLLQGLDEDQRALLVLSELEQWTLREVADYFETSISTVHSRLRVVKQRLLKAYRRAIVRLGDEP